MMKKIFNVKEKIKQTAIEVANDEKGMELWQMLLAAIISVILAGVVLKFFDVSITDLGALLVNKVKSSFSL